MMPDGVTVDTNVISVYFSEHLRDRGEVFELVGEILRCVGVALTDELEFEWKSTCPGHFFDEWLTDEMKKGRVVTVNRKPLPRNVMKVIHQRFGLPRGRGDREVLFCANGTQMRYVLSKDLHFFDPKAKGTSRQHRRKVMDRRLGVFCRYLKRELGITVGALCHCREDLSIA